MMEATQLGTIIVGAILGLVSLFWSLKLLFSAARLASKLFLK